MRRLAVLVLVVPAAVGIPAGGGADAGAAAQLAGAAKPPRLLCKLPPKAEKLAPASRRGLVQHLNQYPVVALASPQERARARLLLARLVGAADSGSWRDERAAARSGFDMRTAPRKPGDLSVRYFHAERRQEPRRRTVLDATRPKALIYANAPGRPLALVGAMWSTRDGELGPNPGGPITRWHSHTVCKEGRKRGLKPLAGGKCPPGARLTQGTSEMLHVWFTRELRSAFAIRAPEPELCGLDLLPKAYCKRR
jgi:hypothetical protein